MIPKTTLEILEFHKLLRLIAVFANSEVSSHSILDIRPLSDREDIELRMEQIKEIRKMFHEGNPLRLSSFSDISGLLIKVTPEGAVLDAQELSLFILVLQILYDVSVQLEDRFDLPRLRELTKHLTGFPDILHILDKSIDTDGNILDTASFLLADLRSKIRKLEGKIRKKLEEMVKDEKISVFLQDNFITTRSGRWVIPVRMDSKGMVPGVVHDVSKSGETAFIEPLGIIHLVNELGNLIAEQKAEEIRILRNICSMIRKVSVEMGSEFGTLVYLDILNAIVKFSDKLNMEPPKINNTETISLVKARHPLLHLSLEKMGIPQEVVPLDITLGGNNTVMVITGANAGGKTIAIKTIGLLQLMALSGMPVTADSSSNFPLIDTLLVDIGDEQSIESNLSTFSAHISNISGILKKTDTKSVVLIDELGTGTDPEEGAALSCAVLKELRKSGALVFATTHLSEIKGFVHRTEGMINASMEFDQKTLTPLFKLRIGEPGQSHALTIAKRYGLPESIIEEAKDMLGSMKLEFDNMIADLQQKRTEYENSLRELGRQKAEMDEKKRLMNKQLNEAEKVKKEVYTKAYSEVSDIISDTRRHMNMLLDELKKKGKSESKRILKEIAAHQKSVSEKIMEYETEDSTIPSIDYLKKGDVVFVKSIGHDATVIDINIKLSRLKVASRNMEIEVPLSDIRYKKSEPLPVADTSFNEAKPAETVSSRLNLVGFRVDEALSKLEHLLNHASLAELREIIVIHGIGKGILKKAITEHMTGHPLVNSFRSGTQEEGGNAVTIVKLK